MMLVLPDQRLPWEIAKSVPRFVSFLPFLISSTYTERNSPLAQLTQPGTFHHPSANGTTSNCLSNKRPTKWLSVQISFKVNHWIFNIFPWILGHLCRGRRILTSGHSDFGRFNNLGASSILECKLTLRRLLVPAQSRSMAMTSITCASVIWDADEPCSVNTAQEPESSFTMSPSEHDSSFTLLKCWFQLGVFLRWQMSIDVAKWTFSLSLC